MKKYSFHIILFVFLVILAVFLQKQAEWTTLGRTGTDFSITGSERVSAIIITDNDNQVRLTRENGKWMVNSKYEAGARVVDMMLQTLQRIRVSGPAPFSGREDLLEKLSDESVRIDIHKGRRSRTYYLYSEDESSPTYIIAQGSTRAFEAEVIGFSGHVASLFVSDEGHWRTNMLFNYKPDDIAEVFVKHRDNPGGSFLLSQTPENKFSLYDYPEGESGEKLNDSLAIRYLANFFYVPYERLARAEEILLMDSLKKSKADHMIRVTDRDGEVSEVFFHKIILDAGEGSGAPDYDIFRLHALINDKNDMIVVTYHSVDLLLRTYSYFYR